MSPQFPVYSFSFPGWQIAQQSLSFSLTIIYCEEISKQVRKTLLVSLPQRNCSLYFSLSCNDRMSNCAGNQAVQSLKLELAFSTPIFFDRGSRGKKYHRTLSRFLLLFRLLFSAYFFVGHLCCCAWSSVFIAEGAWKEMRKNEWWTEHNNV